MIEAELDKSRGPAASLLVQNGTLNVGDAIVVGNTYGRIRAMVNDLGKIKSAGPSTPVEITGINDVPLAGDRFVVFGDENKHVELVKHVMRQVSYSNVKKVKCFIRQFI